MSGGAFSRAAQADVVAEEPGGGALEQRAVTSRRAGRRIRGSLLRTGALRAVVALPPGSAQPHSVSLQLWVLRAAPDGRPDAVPPGRGVLLVDGTRFARTGARESGPHWESLQAFVLSALEALDRPDAADPPDGAVRVPLIEPLDDEVDVTPGRCTSATAEPSGLELAAAWREAATVLTDLARRAERLSDLEFGIDRPQTTVGVGDLVKAGALAPRSGRQPLDGAAAPGGDSVPLLTVADLPAGGTPGGLVAAGSAP